MVVMHVVGNRPQFIKLAPVSRELRKRDIKEIIIHTGQHYDENMSDIFFEELGIPKPMRNLNVGSGTHAQTTAKVMLSLETVVQEVNPACILVYGDTNSTLAAALVAVKFCIPIIHVEAGVRTYNKQNPEECNRVMVDHISDYLCAPDRASTDNLRKEGIDERRIYFTGDVMYDEFRYCLLNNEDNDFIKKFPSDFILMTWHRQENTSDKTRMEKMLEFIEKVPLPVVLPLHPRTRKKLEQYDLYDKIASNPNVIILEPVGYKEMIILLKHCKLLISDSGGASKEASFVGKKCLYTLNLKVWPELCEKGYIQIVDVEDDSSVEQGLRTLISEITSEKTRNPSDCFGDGDAASKIADIVEAVVQ